MLTPAKDNFIIDGVAFRSWVDQRPDFAIKDPIARLGTNAVIPLVKILHLPNESAQIYKIREWVWKNAPKHIQSKIPHWRPQPPGQLKRTALFALWSLGPEAKAAMPDIIRYGRKETNVMVRGVALGAALGIAPESPETFAFWKLDWERTTNYLARSELSILLRAAKYPITQAVPYLLEEITNNLSRPPVVPLEAFEFMGEAALPAVPYIISVITNSPLFVGNMTQLLGEIKLGRAATPLLPALIEMLSQQNPRIVVAALRTLETIGPPAQNAIPYILPWTTNEDTEVRMFALATHAKIEQDPGLAVPQLTALLEKPWSQAAISFLLVKYQDDMSSFAINGPRAALIHLGKFGAAAVPALPVIERSLTNASHSTRMGAAYAIWQISGDSTKSLPELIKTLNSCAEPPGELDHFFSIGAAKMLEDMGPAARPAVPALKRVRGFSMALHRAADAALHRIESTPGPLEVRPVK